MWPFSKKKETKRSYNYKVVRDYDGKYKPYVSSYVEPEWYWVLPGKYDSVEAAESYAVDYIKRTIYNETIVKQGKYP